MIRLEEHMGMPRWVLCFIVIAIGTLGYLAYGTSILDFHFSMIPDNLNTFLSFFWKWIVTPIALGTGALLLFALFISQEN